MKRIIKTGKILFYIKTLTFAIANYYSSAILNNMKVTIICPIMESQCPSHI